MSNIATVSFKTTPEHLAIITTLARSVLALSIIQDGPQPDRNGPRRLEIIKTNLCAYPKPLGVQFQPREHAARPHSPTPTTPSPTKSPRKPTPAPTGS